MKKITFIKQLSVFTTFFWAINFGFGQTTLVAGDIAITGFNSDSPDEFSFVLLRDITNTTQINFTDNGWKDTGSFRTGEGVVTWTSSANLSCGTEIIISNPSGDIYTATTGTATETTVDFDIGTSGDQILVYQGTFASPTFIYALHFDSTSWGNATSISTTAIPTGLTDGINAVHFLSEIDDGNYNCTVTSGASLILAGISTSGNWTTSFARIDTLGGCTFTCGPCSSPAVSWNGVSWAPSAPTLTSAATINGNYNTATYGSFSACSLTVNTGFTLTIENGTYVEVQNDATANGGIIVKSQANFIQKSDTATFTDNSGGGVVVQKQKTLQSWYSYTYWSSPVENETIETVLGDTPADRRFSFNAANFIDTKTEIGNTNTFQPGILPDGLNDDGNDWVNTPTGPMVPGHGYAATAKEIGSAFPRTEQFNFYGKFNNGIVPVPLVSNSGGVYEDLNLVGNPYPCAINAIDFLTYNSAYIGAIYLWDQSTPPSSTTGGSQNSNFSTDDYAMINGSGGIAATSNPLNIPNDFVPSGQGFFVDAAAAGNLIFNNSMRAITNDNSQFFKNTKTKTSNGLANKLWINLTSDNGVFNQILISYINGASNANDGDFYDAPRSLSSVNGTSLYSVIENDNSKFAIQGKDVNSINEDEIINLGFKSTINVPVLFKLSVAQLQGNFLTNNSIFLVDNLLNKVCDLSVCDYTFTSAVGEFNSRFEIAFTNKTLAVNDLHLNTKAFKIIELQDGFVQFKTNNNLSIKAVNIYDLLGRELYFLKVKTPLKLTDFLI